MTLTRASALYELLRQLPCASSVVSRWMPRAPLVFSATVLAVCAAACSPTFNWRDVHPDGTTLRLLLPCKPDSAEKKVPLGDRPAVVRLLGCDAGDASFAVAVVDVGDASRLAAVLAQWQSATLANMKAAPAGKLSDKTATEVVPMTLPGAALQPPPVQVTAVGQRADGTAVRGQAAYFVQGTQVFQAVIYAAQIKPEVEETFFSSLKFE